MTITPVADVKSTVPDPRAVAALTVRVLLVYAMIFPLKLLLLPERVKFSVYCREPVLSPLIFHAQLGSVCWKMSAPFTVALPVLCVEFAVMFFARINDDSAIVIKITPRKANSINERCAACNADHSRTDGGGVLYFKRTGRDICGDTSCIIPCGENQFSRAFFGECRSRCKCNRIIVCR